MFSPRAPNDTDADREAENRQFTLNSGAPVQEIAPAEDIPFTDIPRDPEIPPQPGEAPESTDKIILFETGRLTKPDAKQVEEVHARHAVLVHSLEEEGERQAEERQQAQIDDDYYHHLQWTVEDARVLQERGQAPLVFNESRAAIDWMCGTERRLRKDYKIRPREQSDEKNAEAKTKAFKYVDDVNNGPWHRSNCAKQMFTSGLGWLEEGINLDPEKELIFAGAEDWRRVFRDSRGREFDMSDSRYVFRRKIIDLDYAVALLPGSAQHLSAVAGRWGVEDDEADDVWYLGQKLTSAHHSAWANSSDSLFGDDYTVRRSGSAWDYGRRSSVELLEAWYRVPTRVKVFAGGPLFRKVFNPADPRHQQLQRDRTMMYETVKMQMRCMVMTKYQPCWDGASPYSHGRFPLIPMWGYRRGRDGLVYGSMRGMRDAQDDLNKRRSKALFALSATRTIVQKDKTGDMDIEDLRSELAKVNALVEVDGDVNQAIKVEQAMNMDQVRGNLDMAQGSIEHIRNAGGVSGESLGHETNATSGKAIGLKQEQSNMLTYELFDNFFLAFKLAGQQRLSNIEQFCNQEWTFRLDPQGQKPAEWVTVNKLNPLTGQYMDDITAAQADFIVDQQDYRATLAQAAMESMFNLLTAMAQFAPQVVLNLLDLVVDSSDVPGKEEWVARIRKMTGMRDPTKPPTPEEIAADKAKAEKEAEIEKITMDEAKAKVQVLLSKVNDQNAAKVMKNLTSLLSSIDAAAQMASMPGLASAADGIARSAGLVDETPNDPMVAQPPALPAPTTGPEGAVDGNGIPSELAGGALSAPETGAPAQF